MSELNRIKDYTVNSRATIAQVRPYTAMAGELSQDNAIAAYMRRHGKGNELARLERAGVVLRVPLRNDIGQVYYVTGYDIERAYTWAYGDDGSVGSIGKGIDAIFPLEPDALNIHSMPRITFVDVLGNVQHVAASYGHVTYADILDSLKHYAPSHIYMIVGQMLANGRIAYADFLQTPSTDGQA